MDIELARRPALGEDRSGGVPVVAVMPFTCCGKDPALRPSPLVERLHADVCAALTRFRAFRVVSAQSAARVASLGDREIGARLGASHARPRRGRARAHRARAALRGALAGARPRRARPQARRPGRARAHDGDLAHPLRAAQAQGRPPAARPAPCLDAHHRDVLFIPSRRRRLVALPVGLKRLEQGWSSQIAPWLLRVVRLIG